MHSIKAHARKIHHNRHAHLGMHSTSNHPGHAHGGAAHPHKGHSEADKKADTALVHSLVKPDALKRAHGGRTHGKSKGGTHVNILVGHPGDSGAAQPVPVPMGGPGPGPSPMPPMQARPPMPPMGGGAGGPPPGIGGAPIMPPRKHGGRTAHK